MVSGTAPSASKRVPRCTRRVASPPSSRSMFGPTTSPELVAELEEPLRAPPVVLQRLALPGEDRDAGGLLGRAVADDDRRGGVVLGGEDVAADPADVGTERGQRLDEDGGLHGHVQRAGDAGAGERLRVAVLVAQGHQAGHLVLGELDLLAAEAGEGEVGDLEVAVGQGSQGCQCWRSCRSRGRGAAGAQGGRGRPSAVRGMSEHAEASAGLVPVPRLRAARRRRPRPRAGAGQRRFVVARYRTRRSAGGQRGPGGHERRAALPQDELAVGRAQDGGPLGAQQDLRTVRW